MPPRKKAVATGSEPPAKPPRTALPVKKVSGGNGIADSAWIAEMEAAGELHEPDLSLKPDDYYWEPILQWTGHVDEVNPDFFEFYRLPSNRVRTRTIDMLIARLREKLASGGDAEETILTVRGKGYRFAAAS